MGRRTERIESQLLREISNIITHELSDPRVGFVTITGVKLSDDMQYATVAVSMMGDDDAQARSMKALKRARGHIQGLVAERLKLRWTPVLRFSIDEGVKHSIRISGLLHELAEERQALEESRRDTDEENVSSPEDEDQN